MSQHTQAGTTRYTGDLHRAGAIINETISLLNEYAHLNDWCQIKNSAFKENILKKRSPQTANNMLRAVRKRFFTKVDLPKAEVVADALSKDIPLAAKTQILLVYLCETDLLVKNSLLNLVKPKLGSSQQTLSKDEVYEYLLSEKKIHPELKRWSEDSAKRWSRGFLSVLRDHGFMENAPSTTLIKPTIRTEAFGFFLFYFIEKKAPIRDILESQIWKTFFLNSNEINALLNEAQKRGWIRYLRAGEIIELIPSYSTLGDWLNGLG